MEKRREEKNLDIWREISRLRKREALRKNWFENWANKTGPLFNVPPPQGKREGGRV